MMLCAKMEYAARNTVAKLGGHDPSIRRIVLEAMSGNDGKPFTARTVVNRQIIRDTFINFYREAPRGWPRG